MAGTRERTEGLAVLACATEDIAGSSVFNSVEGIDITAIADGTLCYVHDEDLSFRWRQDSVAAPAPNMVILPAQLNITDSGRWLVLTSGGGIVATPGAPNKSVQFNEAGIFGGSPSFLFNEPAAGFGPYTVLQSSTTSDVGTGYVVKDSLGAYALALMFTEDPVPANNLTTIAGAGNMVVGAGALELSTTNGLSINVNGVGWDWPTTDGPADDVLMTNGAGDLFFSDAVALTRDTAADLRLVAPINKRRAKTLSALVLGDYGGGEWDGVTGAAPGTYAQNTGTVIVPAGGDGSAAWLRKVEQGKGYSPEWFGAKGDGGTNDTAPVQSCINAAPLGGFVEGRPSALYVVNALTMDRRTFRGNGAVLLAAVPNITLITFVNTNQKILSRGIENLEFRGNGLAGVTALALAGCLDVRLDNVRIASLDTGLLLSSTLEAVCTNLNITSCEVGVKIVSPTGVGGGSANAFFGVNIIGCQVGIMGIAEDASFGGTKGNNFSGGTIQACKCGIYLVGQGTGSINRYLIENIHFEGNGVGGPTIIVDGLTVNTGDFVLENASGTARDCIFGNTSTSDSVQARNGSHVLITGETRPVGTGNIRLVYTDDTSTAKLDGVAVLYGHIESADVSGLLVTDVPNNAGIVSASAITVDDSVRSDWVQADQWAPTVTNIFAPASGLGSAIDAQLGAVTTATFGASVGNTGANSVTLAPWPVAPVIGERFAMSVMLRASAPTRVLVYTPYGGQNAQQAVTLTPKWQRVVLLGKASTVGAGSVFIYPTDAAGAQIFVGVGNARYQTTNFADLVPLIQGKVPPRKAIYKNEATAARTLQASDSNATITSGNAAATVFTIPANATTPFPINTEITCIQNGAGVLTITGAGGVTVNGVVAGSVPVGAQYQSVLLKKIATDTWIVDNSAAVTASGTYVPAITNLVNLSTPVNLGSFYTRVGNICRVDMTFAVVRTGPGPKEAQFSIPVPRTGGANFAADGDVAGTMITDATAAATAAGFRVRAETGTQRVHLLATSTLNSGTAIVGLSFTYPLV